MSGELEIDHGGAIAVDTDAMRDVGSRMTGVAVSLEEARGAIDRVCAIIAVTPGFGERVDAPALRASGERVSELQQEVEEASVGTLLMADVFEIVELRAQAEALSVAGAVGAAAVQARIDRMLAADARLGPMADALVAQWEQERFEGLREQWDMGGLLPPFFSIGAFIGATSKLGTILPGMTLQGRADPVAVTAARWSTPSTAPTDLAGAFRRIPSTAGSQIAVEKITKADGSTRFMVYLQGTQNFNPWQAGGSEPWDMKSNAELYTGVRSASYQATVDALAAAGAEPGDRIGVVAHSQAGMIASHLAMESAYHVDLVATAGSPTHPTLDHDQLLVEMAHTDDVVRSLAGGGSPGGTGSPDSFTATRVADPNAGVQDLMLKPHVLDTYIETARMIDESDDPRAKALDEYWAELGGDVTVLRTEYVAERRLEAE